ncbi:FMN-binding protein [Micromonospora sp. DT81.3]|uniref:FMN-binding protein n=1 Tax=Micromonospora sp. DT81.3 TaxID=3416523 RepID=UPI003CF8155A
MKKIVYALLATISGIVLLFSYRTSLEAVEPIASTGPATSSDATTTAPVTPDDSSSDGTSTGSSSTGSATESSDGASSDTTSETTSGLVDGTYTGAAADTRYGPVQVAITVSAGQISDVQVVDYPNSDRRDQQINQRAIPILVSETTQTQSAQIDMVSGATYTSDGYIASLQSAIDQAQS